MHAAVAGAGIAGLTAAIALARRGLAVAVHERSPEPREIGAGIQLSPNAMTVLAHLGLAGQVLDFASEPEAVEIHDGPSGRLLTRLPLGPAARRRYGAPYCVIRRADLHGVLLAHARTTPGIELRFGSAIEHAGSGQTGVTFTAGGVEHRVDLLIAADGVNSRLRTGSFRLPPPRTVAKTAWRATLPAVGAAAMLPAGVTGLWLGRGAHLVHYPVSRGAEINVVVIGNSTAGASKPPLHLFGGLGADLGRAWAMWAEWSLQTIAPAQWARGRMILIGDAAHAMLPSGAQGGAQAIEDAWFLAQALPDDGERLPQALAAFADARRPRVERIARESERNLAVYNLAGIGALARNAAIAALPASLHLARLDWLYRLPGGSDSA